MRTLKDHRQPNNPRNNRDHDEVTDHLDSLLQLLPVKPIPLTISQQFQIAQLMRIESTPITEKPTTLKKG